MAPTEPTIKWNSQLTSKFIKLYKERECLWKTDDPNYRSQFHRERAIKQIVACMGIPVLTPQLVKKRIKSLRATFMITLKKVIESKQSNDGRVYRPTLSWFKDMAAFIKYDNETVLAGGKPMLQTAPIKFENEYNDGGGDDDDDDEDACSDEKEAIYFIEHSGDWDTQEKYPSTSNQTTTKTTLREDATNFRMSMGTTKTNDEFNIFGTHVACQLRLLSPEQAILAQDNIQSVLTKCRLRDIKTARKENNRTSDLAHNLNSGDSDASKESSDNDELVKEKKYY